MFQFKVDENQQYDLNNEKESICAATAHIHRQKIKYESTLQRDLDLIDQDDSIDQHHKIELRTQAYRQFFEQLDEKKKNEFLSM